MWGRGSAGSGLDRREGRDTVKDKVARTLPWGKIIPRSFVPCKEELRLKGQGPWPRRMPMALGPHPPGLPVLSAVGQPAEPRSLRRARLVPAPSPGPGC